LTKTLEADEATKGKLLETLIEDIFTGVEGLTVMKRNARLRAEEIDLIVRNNLTNGFWRMAGSPVIVECKNWSGKVGAREISILLEKLQALSPDAKTGILVSPNGITGDFARDAALKVREARQRGRYILVLDAGDLRRIVEGASLEHVIEKKYEQLLLI
jgi:Holliday junction resolvase-like predicted endonuclease